MLDIGWTEIVVVGVVALVVLGPKELPRALKTMGAFMGKARAMAREFQSGVDEMIRESELDDLRKDLQNATRMDFDEKPANRIDPTSGKPALAAPDPAAPNPAVQEPQAATPQLPADASATQASSMAAAAETSAAVPAEAASGAAAPDNAVAGETQPVEAGPATQASVAAAAPAPQEPAVPRPAVNRSPQGPATVRPAAPASADAPPFESQGFDQDYAGATEAQALGEFRPPEAGDEDDAPENGPEQLGGGSVRAAE